MITNRSQNHSAPVRNGFPSIDCPLPRRTEGFGSGTCILKSLRRLCTCAAFTLLTRNLQQRILIRFYGSATTDLRKRNAVNDKEKRPALCLQMSSVAQVARLFHTVMLRSGMDPTLKDQVNVLRWDPKINTTKSLVSDSVCVCVCSASSRAIEVYHFNDAHETEA